MIEELTLEDLLNEGNEIRNNLINTEPKEIFESKYNVYSFQHSSKYERWKYKVIRLLSKQFKGDRCVSEFEKSANCFELDYNSPKTFDVLLGIIESCIAFPDVIPPSDVNQTSITGQTNQFNPILSINVSQNQSQYQSQHQEAVNIFFEAIKDELNDRQLNELKSIINEEHDPTKAKEKIIEKIKSFGLDLTSNILTNIITNPAIWNMF